jgi:hypothetical protein
MQHERPGVVMDRSRLLFATVVAALSPAIGCAQPDAKPEVFGAFVGSSPCGDPLGKLFDIPADANPPVRWALTLFQNPKTKSPTTYKLRVEYDGAKPPTARKPVTKEKEGRWSVGKGTKSDPDAVVYELAGAVNFLKVSDEVLHAVNPDRTLAVGNGGWSYSLYRSTAAEKVVPPSAEAGQPDESYTISPLASGEDVFGVFEGRTPRGIAREMKIDTEDRMKAKWRVTLYQDPKTKAPTTYKIEGSLYRKGAREGTWSVVRDKGAVVYHLAKTKTEGDYFLLKGDDNVLFFLGQDRKPLVGHADFSYTLNRRDTTKPAK